MASFHRELPSEGLIKVDIELWRGNLTVRSARPGETGALESDWELDATTDGSALRARQPLDIKRPFGLADLIGEQQVRIEIDGVVLFDKQIRHGGGDVRIVLPVSVREVRCRTARGDIHLEGVEAVAEAYTGRGNVLLSDGTGRAAAGTTSGDVKVSGWSGALHIRTGNGNLEVRSVHGDLDARTSKGEITIEGARARVDARTGHGDIVCRLAAAEGDHELHTGRGNIVLDLHGGMAARIDASTRHGGIDSNLPLVRVGTSGPAGVFSQRLVGTTAGSDPTASIHLNTKGGDIRIFRREERTSDSAPTDTTPASGEVATVVEPQADQPRSVELEILGAVSRGELSVDEAMVLLGSMRTGLDGE